jgi:hypothetical protein
MLTASNQAAYISEPTNLLHRPGVLRVPVQCWYPYICSENEAGYLAALQEMLSFRYHLWAEIRSLRSKKDLLRMLRDLSIFIAGRLEKKRLLMKDPFALFSSPWFAERLDCQVVITIRHPAAFASSLHRLNWPFDFQHLLAQPYLMQHWLEPFQEEMQAMQTSQEHNPKDIVGPASLLWRIIYQVVKLQQAQHPDFMVVRHEDLSLEPLEGFEALYEKLNLKLTPQAQAKILKSSSSENPKEVSKSNIYAVSLDSQANLHNWKRRLTAEQTRRIRSLTEETAALYYPEYEWE